MKKRFKIFILLACLFSGIVVVSCSEDSEYGGAPIEIPEKKTIDPDGK